MDERKNRRRSEHETDEDIAAVLMTISAVAKRLAKRLMIASAKDRMHTRQEETHERRDEGLHRRGHDYPEYRY
jgi:hypothetical protein